MKALSVTFFVLGAILILSGVSVGTRAEIDRMTELEKLNDTVSFVGGFVMVGIGAIIMILCDRKKVAAP